MRIKELVGKGSVERRSKNSHRLRQIVVYTNGEKKPVFNTVPASSKTQAQKALNEWRVELLSNAVIHSGNRITVSEMLDKYLMFCRENKNLALRTLEGYRKIAERYLRPELGNRFIDELTPEEIEDFFIDLRTTGGMRGQPLSGSTCSRIKSVLSPMFKRAMFHRYIDFNPCTPITMPSSEKVEMKVLSHDRVQRFLSLLKGLLDQRLAMVLRFAVFSGCRRGEMCGLRWADVDFERQTVHLRHSLAEVAKIDAPNGETLHLKDTKTHENRNLSMDRETMVMLHEYKIRQTQLLAYYGIELTELTPVFSNVFGEWYRPSVLTKNFEAFASQNGFDIRLHDLRHTHASILIANHMSIVDVSKRLGHAKVSITLDIYSHMMPGQDRAIADKLGDLFSPELPPEPAPAPTTCESRVPSVYQCRIIRVPFTKIDPSYEEPIRENVVVGGGLEPSTRGFSVRCSTN